MSMEDARRVRDLEQRVEAAERQIAALIDLTADLTAKARAAKAAAKEAKAT